MTNEEAIELIKVAQAEVEWSCPMDYAAAFDLAIKALEQTDTLDKIRAEIEEYKSRQLTLAIGVADLEAGKQIAIEYILSIIDKYKAESEVQDADSEDSD